MRAEVLLGLSLLGCGHVFRIEAGPTWLEPRGMGGTLQATTGLALIAGAGLFEMLVLGGYGTAYQSSMEGGLFVGVDVGIAPGGVDQGPNEPREGLGGTARFHPRFGTDGVVLGAGLGLSYGEGELDPEGGGRISLGGHEKFDLSIDWDERVWWNLTAAVDVQSTLEEDGDFAREGLRVDVLFGGEYLVLTD